MDRAHPDCPVIGKQCLLEERVGAHVGAEITHDGSFELNWDLPRMLSVVFPPPTDIVSSRRAGGK
jgi:hypothetical protein